MWNINQKYLYEMTNYYGDVMDGLGNLHYGRFDDYFTNPERAAYLFYEEGALVGFAMIHPYSDIGGKPDHVLAEFTVFPMYRRRHFAITAAGMIFGRMKGRWEVKYNEKNKAAKALWNKVTEKYGPEKVRLDGGQTVLVFCS